MVRELEISTQLNTFGMQIIYGSLLLGHLLLILCFRSPTRIAMSHRLKFIIIKSFYHYFIILVVGNNKLTFFYAARNRGGQLRLSFHS